MSDCLPLLELTKMCSLRYIYYHSHKNHFFFSFPLSSLYGTEKSCFRPSVEQIDLSFWLPGKGLLCHSRVAALQQVNAGKCNERVGHTQTSSQGTCVPACLVSASQMYPLSLLFCASRSVPSQCIIRVLQRSGRGFS